MADALRRDLKHAERLERATLGWMAAIIAMMTAVMGSSQALRTALIEDVLSLIPAAVFLLARRYGDKPPTPRFPFGYARVHSLAFAVAAVTLAGMGAVLAIESALTLVKGERPAIGAMTAFGETFWAGWAMIAALALSVIPPVLLGRLKQPLAERLQDKVLHTDAKMQQADWETGLAGIAGVLAVGLGLWWADATAALIIAVSILRDGIRALKQSAAELMDGAPRALHTDEIAEDAAALKRALAERWPGRTVKLRESGRCIVAMLSGALPGETPPLAELWPGPPERAWRLQAISFEPGAETEEA